MSISAIPSSMAALSLSLSQLQDSVAVIAGASQANSAVASQGFISASQAAAPAAAKAVQSYGPTANYSAGVVVGNALNITV